MVCALDTDQKLKQNISRYGTSRNTLTHASGGAVIANRYALENIR
jgi:hypothetical protein